MDDIAVFDDSRARLADLRVRIEAAMAALRLKAHAKKTRIIPCSAGIPFVGSVAFPHRTRLDGGNVRRMRRKLRAPRAAGARGWITAAALTASMTAWVAHARHADTARLQRALDVWPAPAGAPPE